MACRLEEIPDDFGVNYFKCDLSLRKKQKAQAFVSGCFVECVNFMKVDGNIVRIHGKVYPSVKKSDSPHVVEMDIGLDEKRVTNAYCKCKQGIDGTCSHILAIIYIIEQWKIAGYKDVPAILPSTSLPQQWDKPRGSKIKPEPVSHMVFARPVNICRKRKPVMAEFTDNREITVTNEHINELKKLKSSPISYLTEATTSLTTYTDTPIGQQIVGSGLSYHAHLIESVYAPRQEDGCGELDIPVNTELTDGIKNLLICNSSHWKQVAVTNEDAKTIEYQTRLQSNCKEWHLQRKQRITASVFGAIMNRQKKVNESFMKNTFHQKPFVSKPTSYGQVHEKTAKVMYIKKTENHLHDVGLVVNPEFPFIGASPDGLVCSGGITGLLEVKCPYSARNMTAEEAVKNNVKNFCLVQNRENLQLNRTHSYYFQVQGQLLVTGLPFCDFVVYTKDNIFIERIMPNKEVMFSILEKMTNFYISDFKAFVSSVKV